mmetsp:Transcript_29182/g.86398  ORF Transcript_29182/g.86398 Transcript_29182/m.86398 type:complete len:247 (-) Transcript_29182:1323-2063(-)
MEGGGHGFFHRRVGDGDGDGEGEGDGDGDAPPPFLPPPMGTGLFAPLLDEGGGVARASALTPSAVMSVSTSLVRRSLALDSAWCVPPMRGRGIAFFVPIPLPLPPCPPWPLELLLLLRAAPPPMMICVPPVAPVPKSTDGSFDSYPWGSMELTTSLNPPASSFVKVSPSMDENSMSFLRLTLDAFRTISNDSTVSWVSRVDSVLAEAEAPPMDDENTLALSGGGGRCPGGGDRYFCAAGWMGSSAP